MTMPEAIVYSSGFLSAAIGFAFLMMAAGGKWDK